MNGPSPTSRGSQRSRHGAHPERAGAAAALAAFVAWGILPVFWKALKHIPSAEILAQRVLWTVLFVAALVAHGRRLEEVRSVLRSRRGVATCVLAALFLGANWSVFIHAVNSGHVVECSLGYFINPLVNVLLGFLFLRERFRSWQVLAIALAAAGVAIRTAGYGQVPWMALSLAGTFGLYGLLRKVAGYESLPGLFLETLFLAPCAAAYLALLGPGRWESLRHPDLGTWTLLAATGVVTALPLVAFAFGARRIRLSTVGFLQYLTPTGMFLLGVLLYREPFASADLATFALIWAGLAIYTVGTVRAAARRGT